MVIAHHTVTGTLLVPGTTDTGLQATVTFLPMTVNNALAFPDDNVTTYGPVTVDTDENGALSAEIPETPEGVLWRVRVAPIVDYVGVTKGWTEGTFAIDADTDWEELVNVSPTAVTPTLFEDISEKAELVVAAQATTDGQVGTSLAGRGLPVNGADLAATIEEVGDERYTPGGTAGNAGLADLALKADADPALKLSAWRAALANRENTPAVAAFLGDSITEHFSASAHSKTFSKALARMLRARFPVAGVTGGAGFISCRAAGGVPLFTWPIVASGTALNVSNNGSPKRMLSLLPVGAILTATVRGTSLDILGRKVAGTELLTVTVDGGAPTDYNFSNPTTLYGQKVRVNLGSSGVHTVVMEAKAGNTGQLLLSGVIVYDGDEDAGIHVHECGFYGIKTGDWVVNVASAATNWPIELAALGADLVVITLGINDRTSGVDPAVTKANLETMIGWLRSTAGKPQSILLHAVYVPSNAGTYPWSAYKAVMQEIADADAGISYFEQDAMPNVSGDVLGLYSDAVHPTDKGMSMLAAGLADFVAPH